MMYAKFKRYMLTGLLVFVVSSILFASCSYADESGALFSNLIGTGAKIFDGMRDIIWQAAGLGVLAVAVGGLFGNFNWKWLAAIAIGLAVIGLTGGILRYLTDNQTGGINIADTLK